jgi:hypothetical protein
MNKEELIRLIKADTYTEEDIRLCESLKDEYPWFSLPRFIELKIRSQLGMQSSSEELSGAAVFSGDRKHLYEWTNELIDTNSITVGKGASEIEFLDDDGDQGSGLSFELMAEVEDRMETDADAVGFSEKDEADMEEPEIEPESAVPSIDPIEEEPDTEPIAEQEAEFIELDTESVSEEIVEKQTVTGEASKPENAPAVTKSKSNGLIEKFLEKDPGVIKADKETTLEGDVSSHSIKEDDSYITDTLAKIYVKQGLHAKAIYAYERLSLKYPEKSAYFAAQIEKIKENTNR